MLGKRLCFCCCFVCISVFSFSRLLACQCSGSDSRPQRSNFQLAAFSVYLPSLSPPYHGIFLTFVSCLLVVGSTSDEKSGTLQRSSSFDLIHENRASSFGSKVNLAANFLCGFYYFMIKWCAKMNVIMILTILNLCLLYTGHGTVLYKSKYEIHIYIFFNYIISTHIQYTMVKK